MSSPPLFRYLLFCGVLIAAAWGFFSVKVGDRTLYAHARQMSGGRVDNVIARFKKELAAEAAKDAPKEATVKKAKQQRERRVSKLREAAKLAGSDPSPTREKDGAKVAEKKKKGPKKKTVVDERIRPEDEKALDDLLTARVRRLHGEDD